MSHRDGRAIHWAEAFGLSAAVHVGVVFFALDFINDIRFLPPEDTSRPDLLVTSLVLDADTLAQATQVGAETTPGTTDPDVAAAEDIPPETLTGADVAPEAPVAPDPAEAATPTEEIAPTAPETPDIATPEEALTPEPEALAEIAPETPEPVQPDIETPDAIIPDALPAEVLDAVPATPVPEAIAPVVAAPLIPEEISPLRPQNETLAALAASPGNGVEQLSGVAPSIAPSIAPVAIAPTVATPVTVAPVVTRPPVPAPAPTAAPPPPPPPGSPAAVVAELLTKIRARVSDACLVAMPQTAQDGAPELVVLSSSEVAIGEFIADVLDGIEPSPGQRGVLIDPRQCDALTYIRENPAYPAFRLTAGLTTDQLSGQAMLQGAIGRAGGNYVSLLLVDDNGVVQVLNQYLTFAAGEARFDVPLRRAGNARDTSAMLIAIASNARPATLDQQNGQTAEVFFQALRAELGSNPPLVMIPFDLR